MIKEYAELYSTKEGWFSLGLAQNIVSFLKKRRLPVFKVLDVACGTGEFVSIMRNTCPECKGIDFAAPMIEVAKRKIPDIDFQVAAFIGFDLKEKFDLVSCNYESVNFVANESELKKLFSNVARHLNKDGLFVFDFATPNKIVKDELLFEEKTEFDYVKRIFNTGNGYGVNEVFYKPSTKGYSKIVNNEKRIFLDVKLVNDMLEKTGFKDINFVDYDLVPLKKPEKEKRVHVVCFKK